MPIRRLWGPLDRRQCASLAAWFAVGFVGLLGVQAIYQTSEIAGTTPIKTRDVPPIVCVLLFLFSFASLYCFIGIFLARRMPTEADVAALKVLLLDGYTQGGNIIQDMSLARNAEEWRTAKRALAGWQRRLEKVLRRLRGERAAAFSTALLSAAGAPPAEVKPTPDGGKTESWDLKHNELIAGAEAQRNVLRDEAGRITIHDVLDV
jgi:hypothetical protein